MQLDGRTKKQKWKQTSKFDFLPEKPPFARFAGLRSRKALGDIFVYDAPPNELKETKKSNFIDDYVCQLCVREIVLSIYFLLCLTENFGFAPSRAERGSVMSFLR